MNTSGTALVTGTSTGLGRQIALTLAREGFTVFAGMREIETRNSTAAGTLRKEAGDAAGDLYVLKMDVTDAESVEIAVTEAARRVGGLDVVVNNAAVGSVGLAEATTPEQWARVFDVNVFGAQRVNRAALPHMRKHGKGLLIHIASLAGRIVLPGGAAYMASKAALEVLAESYRYELAPLGIDSVIVEPGGFGTRFFANAIHAADIERAAGYGPLADLPEKIAGGIEQSAKDAGSDPQSVADAVVSLIRTPLGQRPLRTIVDPVTGGGGVARINDVAAEIQTALLTAFGLSDLLGSRTV